VLRCDLTQCTLNSPRRGPPYNNPERRFRLVLRLALTFRGKDGRGCADAHPKDMFLWLKVCFQVVTLFMFFS
jgi:hypothetical protein